MKRFLQFVLVLLITLSSMVNVNAKTEEELIDYMSKTFVVAGKEVKLTDADIVKLERYLSENTVSSDNCDKIIEKIDEIIAIMNNAKVTDPTKLSYEKRQEVLAIAKDAATLAGASLTYDNTNKVVSIYKDGKLVDTASIKPYKLAQTGNSNTIYFVIAGLAIVAGGAVIYRKTRKDA